jgi:thiamine biosynthesis lipoprotein
MRSALLPLILLTLVGCQPSEPQIIQGKTMGTTWSLRALGADENARPLIQTHLDQREAVLSHWRKDSALSIFNAATSTDWQPVPQELVKVVELARRIADQTDEALDISLGRGLRFRTEYGCR